MKEARNAMFVAAVFCFIIVVTTNAQTGSFPDCKSGPLSTFPICNQVLPIGQRATDLISRMNTTEKISQLDTGAAAIPRLGLPKFQWWSEALHGVARSPGVSFGGDLPAATSFPMPINLGASFNMSLVHSMASVISTEARAFNNEGRAGLVFFTPNINIFRDPRWGRGAETPGEDPYLTSEYVYSYIRGLQNGDDERYLKVAADCKHYSAYDVESWGGTDRHHFNAIVSDQDLVETFNPPFETCIRDARVASIMCSYNEVNGIPSCANRFLLQTLARDSYHLDGFVVSDCDAINDIFSTHHYASTPQDAVADALHAGTDLDCDHFYGQHAQEALDNGAIVEADIDQALHRTFSVLLRLGYFDPPEQQPYRQLTPSAVDTNTSRQLALDAALQGMVLLKNQNNALPLNFSQVGTKTIALIGPHANATVAMQGNYFGVAPYLISPLLAFQAMIPDTKYAQGCQISANDTSGFAAAIELARSADIVLFCGGIDRSIEVEGRDRQTVTLPDIQVALLEQLSKVVRSPLHVVLISGGALDLSFIRDSNQYASLIWAGYPGQSGGVAIAKTIFGQYNPGGRLPVTYYPASYVDAVSMLDMQMRPSSSNPGRTYKFYTGQPIFEFGYGLSYTTFKYSWNNQSMTSSYSIQTLLEHDYGEKRLPVQSIRVNVTNTGPMAGDEVVLAFMYPPKSSFSDPSPPIKELIGFERIHLDVNETKEVIIPVHIRSLLTVALNGSKWLEPGLYRISINNQYVHTIHLEGASALWSMF